MISVPQEDVKILTVKVLNRVLEKEIYPIDLYLKMEPQPASKTVFQLQWNSLKTSLIKKFSCQICQNKEAPKCDTDCNQFTLCMYHFSITIVATTVLVLLATPLLTLFSSVPVWRGLDYIMPLWQHSAEGSLSVRGPAAVCCCQPEIDSEQVAFHTYYIQIMILV